MSNEINLKIYLPSYIAYTLTLTMNFELNPDKKHRKLRWSKKHKYAIAEEKSM